MYFLLKDLHQRKKTTDCTELQQTFKKNDAFQLSHGVKSIHRNKLYQQHTQCAERFL